MSRDEMNSAADEPVFLVVDDDAQVLSIVCEYLERFGFRKVLQARNGQQALKYIQDLKQPVDIVISDWEMPQVDGLTLLKAVRKNPGRKDTKFIMITSQVSQERMKVSQAIQLKVDAYIVKPFRGDVLREKVLNLVSEWAAQLRQSS